LPDVNSRRKKKTKRTKFINSTSTFTYNTKLTSSQRFNHTRKKYKDQGGERSVEKISKNSIGGLKNL
jgi:hypothetical protein